MELTSITPIAKAVDEAGGVAVIATAFGISPQAVYKWIRAGKAPGNRCVRLEQLSNFVVSRHELCPDTFGEKPIGH